VFDTKSALETRPGGISPPLAENDKTSIPEGCRRRHQKDDKTHCELLHDYPREYIARRRMTGILEKAIKIANAQMCPNGGLLAN
jgi:hypothetical protein